MLHLKRNRTVRICFRHFTGMVSIDEIELTLGCDGPGSYGKTLVCFVINRCRRSASIRGDQGAIGDVFCCISRKRVRARLRPVFRTSEIPVCSVACSFIPVYVHRGSIPERKLVVHSQRISRSMEIVRFEEGFRTEISAFRIYEYRHIFPVPERRSGTGDRRDKHNWKYVNIRSFHVSFSVL